MRLRFAALKQQSGELFPFFVQCQSLMSRETLKHCCRCAICSALPTVHAVVSIDQMLGKGEPPMRSHWTNPTIIRRPMIAALSTAVFLVACDQPTGPSARRGGGILADAHSGTVS